LPDSRIRVWFARADRRDAGGTRDGALAARGLFVSTVLTISRLLKKPAT
jgi:hypothetical protein